MKGHAPTFPKDSLSVDWASTGVTEKKWLVEEQSESCYYCTYK